MPDVKYDKNGYPIIDETKTKGNKSDPVDLFDYLLFGKSYTPNNKKNTSEEIVEYSDSSKYNSFLDEGPGIQALIQSHGIYDRYKMDWYNKFARIGIIDPINTMTTTKEYIFFTKPDLYIIGENNQLIPSLARIPIFIDAYERYFPIIQQLQYGIDSKPFSPLLSNALTSGVDIPSISANTIETAGNVYGTKISYRGSSVTSDENHDFSLEFEDTKYMELYTYFKLYDEYERLKAVGNIDFSDSEKYKAYIRNKILHDQIAIYKIVVGEDGETILYFARLVGAFPISVPRESFSDMNSNETQRKITVSWKAQFVRDSDIRVIWSFNRLTSNLISGRRKISLYDTNIKAFNGEWASYPFIEASNTSGKSQRGKMMKYRLRWYA